MQRAFFAEAFTGGIACTQLKQEQKKHQQQILRHQLFYNPWLVVTISNMDHFKTFYLEHICSRSRTLNCHEHPVV